MAFTFATNVNPDGNQTRSLGSSSAKWKINGHIPELIEVEIEQTNETSVTVTDSNITADHIVLNPFALDSEISYTTGAGTATFTCASGFANTVLYLGIKAAESDSNGV